VARLKTLSIASPFLVFAVLSIGKTVTATAFNPAPLFKDVASYKTTIFASNYSADIYFPSSDKSYLQFRANPLSLLLWQS
jgi:hypothetical protein